MNSGRNSEAFIAWPAWSNFKSSTKLSVLFFIVFYGLFWVTDFLISLHDYRIHAYFDWELKIPRITWMSLIYLSLSPLLLLAPFIIREAKHFKNFFEVMVLETLIASVIFLIIPMEAAYIYQEPVGFFAPFFILADAINLTYNEAPSLHVAFAFTAAWTFSKNANMPYRLLMNSWAIVIAISTITTHQHHIIGVVLGVLLAWFTVKISGNKQ